MKQISSRISVPTFYALLLTSLLLLLNLISLFRPHALFPSTSDASEHIPPLSRGIVYPLLHKQNLSHAALHSTLRLHIAALFQPRAVGVVGVAKGYDVHSFASADYRVHAVEPGAEYMEELRKEVSQHNDWSVRINEYAAGDSSNNYAKKTVTYLSKTVASSIATRRIDDLIPKDEVLAVLSIDVQGAEPGVLRGATTLMPGRVHSLTVEASACDKGLLQVLELLDKDYVLFDFIPRGEVRQDDGSGQERLANLLDPHRPGKFAEYDRWMCQRSRRDFKWVQTDFLAVRRDLVLSTWSRLAILGAKYCGQQGIFCKMRLVGQ